MTTGMRVERSNQGDISVIALVGDLDGVTAAQAGTDLGQLAPERGRLVVDLSRARFRSSFGLRLLLLLDNRARQLRLRVAVACVPPQLRAVMSATGFLRDMVVVDTVEAGIEALRS
jgi:anti-sigma B factor antagonist